MDTRPGRVPLVEIVITEQLDRLTLFRLRALLNEALALRPDLILLDLAACPSIDAEGIEILLDIHRRAIHAGGRLTLRATSARLRRNLRLARVDRVLHLAPSCDAAPPSPRPNMPQHGSHPRQPSVGVAHESRDTASPTVPPETPTREEGGHDRQHGSG